MLLYFVMIRFGLLRIGHTEDCSLGPISPCIWKQDPQTSRSYMTRLGVLIREHPLESPIRPNLASFVIRILRVWTFVTATHQLIYFQMSKTFSGTCPPSTRPSRGSCRRRCPSSLPENEAEASRCRISRTGRGPWLAPSAKPSSSTSGTGTSTSRSRTSRKKWPPFTAPEVPGTVACATRISIGWGPE